MHIVPDINGLLQDFCLAEQLLAALRALDRFLAIEAPELFDDLLLMADDGLIVHIGVVLLLAKCLFAFCIDGIVSVKEHAFSVFQFQDLRDGAVQKIPVMGHDEDGPLVVHEVSLQPSDAVHVQVVGRFVEHDQLGALKQELSQCDPGLLASGEGRDGLIQLLGSETETLEDAHDFPFIGIAVLALKFMQKIGILCDRLCKGFPFEDLHIALESGQALLHINKILLDREHLFVDRALRKEPLVLRQIAETAVPLKGDGAFIRVFLAHDDL